MAHAGVDHLRAARRRPVAQAIAVRAEVGAALDHLARESGTAAATGRSSPRQPGRGGSPGRSTACRPPPGGARRTSRPSTPRRCRPCRRGRSRSTGRSRPAPGRRSRAPTARGSRRASSSRVARRALPARRPRRKSQPSSPPRAASSHSASRRQLLPGPGRVRLGVLVGDVHHGLVLAALGRARRAVGMAPAGAGRPGPPLAQMPEVDRSLRPREDQRAGHEVLGRSAGERARVERALGDGDVARLVDERREQAVRDLERVDPEALDADAVRRRLLRIVRVGAHPVRRPVDPDHVLRRGGHAKTVDQSFLMLTTVQLSACARSSEASAPAV